MVLNEKEFDVGVLSQARRMDYDDLLLMLKILVPYKEKLTLLLDVLHSEDDFIKFLDLFAGGTITIPSRSRLYFVMFNIDVYRYYNDHKDMPDGVSMTLKRFHITKQRLNAILKRVSAFDNKPFIKVD